ncbi:hypothetical protein AGOR_G00101530 [Albula goreensis]|uniref:C2H2-type domain-containing protein n=1 Tax=Albula goreensis TaxID=1534307 RepID=A0A8T3DDV8_9TELE|nr:hypothetical protein AGOR_G00101530 [Albula goreensis]
MTYYGVNFQEQLHSILVALTNDAMTEIGKLIEDGSAVLRLEIYHSQRENETLKRRMLDMENELKAFRQNVKKRAEPRKNAFATQYSPAEENDVEQSLGTRGLLSEPLIKKERLEGCENCPCADWRGNVLEAEGCVDVEWGLSLTQPLAVAMQPSAAGDLEHSSPAEEWPRSGEEQLGPAGEQPSPAEASLVSDHLPSDFCYATEGDAGSLPAQAELDLFPIAGAGVSESQPFKEEGGLQPRWAEEVGSGLSPAHSGQFRDCSGNRVVQEEAHARPLVRPCSVRVEYLAVQSSPERVQDASENEAVADSSRAPERPFVCTYCGKAFTWNISLKRHMQTHSRDRPFACPQCPRAFSASTPSPLT